MFPVVVPAELSGGDVQPVTGLYWRSPKAYLGSMFANWPGVYDSKSPLTTRFARASPAEPIARARVDNAVISTFFPVISALSRSRVDAGPDRPRFRPRNTHVNIVRRCYIDR